MQQRHGRRGEWTAGPTLCPPILVSALALVVGLTLLVNSRVHRCSAEIVAGLVRGTLASQGPPSDATFHLRFSQHIHRVLETKSVLTWPERAVSDSSRQ